eukprot:g2308.t1
MPNVAREYERVFDVDDAQNNEPLSRHERRLLEQCIGTEGFEAKQGTLVAKFDSDEEVQSIPFATQEDDEEEEEEVRWGGTAGSALAASIVASESASAAMRVMAGHLVKRAVRTGKDWKRRFFVLTDDRLVYYKGEVEARDALGLKASPSAKVINQGTRRDDGEQPLPPYPCIAHTTEKVSNVNFSSADGTKQTHLHARSLSSGRILPPMLSDKEGASIDGSHSGSSTGDMEVGVNGFAAATGTLFLLPHSRVMSFNEWRRRLVRPTVLFSPAAATARGALRTFDDNERVIARRPDTKARASAESVADLPPPPMPPPMPQPPLSTLPSSLPPPPIVAGQYSEDASEAHTDSGAQGAHSGLDPEECPTTIAPFHFVVVTERAAIHLAAQNAAEQKAWMAAIRFRIARMDTGVGRALPLSRAHKVTSDDRDREAQSLSARGFLHSSTGAVARMQRHHASDTASTIPCVGKDATVGADEIAYVQRVVLTGRQANWYKAYYVVMPSMLMAFVQGGASSEDGVTNGVNAGVKGVAAAWSANSFCGDSNVAYPEHDLRSSTPGAESSNATQGIDNSRHTRAASATFDSLTLSEAAFGDDETRARALSLSSRQRLARTKMQDTLCLTTRAVKRDVALTARTVLRDCVDVGGNVDNAIFALSEDGGVRWQWFRAPDRPAKALWLTSIKAALAGARLLRPLPGIDVFLY